MTTFDLNRRALLGGTAAALGAPAFGARLDDFVNPLAPKQPHFRPRAKSVIFLFSGVASRRGMSLMS